VAGTNSHEYRQGGSGRRQSCRRVGFLRWPSESLLSKVNLEALPKVFPDAGGRQGLLFQLSTRPAPFADASAKSRPRLPKITFGSTSSSTLDSMGAPRYRNKTRPVIKSQHTADPSTDTKASLVARRPMDLLRLTAVRTIQGLEDSMDTRRPPGNRDSTGNKERWIPKGAMRPGCTRAQSSGPVFKCCNKTAPDILLFYTGRADRRCTFLELRMAGVNCGFYRVGI
jgi:hypothetical protein